MTTHNSADQHSETLPEGQDSDGEAPQVQAGRGHGTPKLLILSLPSRKLSTSIRLALKVLSWSGYRFTTISQALVDPEHASICLCFDFTERSGHDPHPRLLSDPWPATLLVSSAALPASSAEQDEGFREQLMDYEHSGFEIAVSGPQGTNLALCSSAEQKQIVGDTQRRFAELLGHSVKIFCYPMGAYDATTISCLREAGFSAALTQKSGLNVGADFDAMQLQRISLGHGLRSWLALAGHIGRNFLAKNSIGSLEPSTQRQRLRSGAQA